MRFTDTHTHLLSFLKNGTLPAVLLHAKDLGVHRLITIGTSQEDWAPYQQLATEASNNIQYTVGLHPCYVEEGWDASVERLEGFFKQNSQAKPLGLGEIGLDGFHLPEQADVAAKVLARQGEAFEAQLALAKRLDVPVVVHSRGQFDACLAAIDKSGINPARVVFHCFVEGVSAMQALMDRGIWASFTGVVTYKNADTVREALSIMGPDRLMIETDAPYLTPIPHRGKLNEPAYLVHTAEACAQVLKIPLSLLSKKTEKAVAAFWGVAY